MSYTRAYQQGQLAALCKLGFATPNQALAAHAAVGGALGGLGGYALSDEHPIATTVGGTLGGAGVGYGLKHLLNIARHNKMQRAQRLTNDLFDIYQEAHLSPDDIPTEDLEYLKHVYNTARDTEHELLPRLLKKQKGWL